MVVDDEEFCIASMEQLLTVAGLDSVYQVDYCINGQEALEKVVSLTKLGQSYKIIFSDFSMPVMDGIEACKKIREFLKAGGHNQPAIIGVTGHVIDAFK